MKIFFTKLLIVLTITIGIIFLSSSRLSAQGCVAIRSVSGATESGSALPDKGDTLVGLR
ncbi:MAG: hypothetical protein H7X71_04660 [Chitinophagales bacterium]|nr:hypothetical protein [Chitinophagales bacterium]